MKRWPNFFIVGAAKSGTTAMHEYLAAHPDIFMAEKEPHYFARDLLRHGHPSLDLDNYMALFAAARDEKVVGESSVFYLYSRVAAGLVKEYSPNARILIHVRSPLEVIPSHHSQLVYVGGETVMDLRTALVLEPLRRQGKHLNERFPYREVFLYREFVRFAEQIERFIQVFGRERVHVVVYDDFAKDTAGVYEKVLEFLEVDPSFRPEFKVVNANKTMRSERLMNLVVRDPPAWACTISRALLPLEARYKIKGFFERLNTRYHKRESLDPELVRELKRDLSPEVQRLSELLGRN